MALFGSDPEGNSLLFEITRQKMDICYRCQRNTLHCQASNSYALQEPRRTLRSCQRYWPPKSIRTGNIRINISRQAVGRNSSLLYLVPDDDSVDNIWMQTDFDDSEWDTGKLGLGYDTNADYDDGPHRSTHLDAKQATTAFTRIPFQVPNTVAVGELRFDMHMTTDVLST